MRRRVRGLSFRDKDYVVDRRGVIYEVVGYLHRKGRITVLPKYMPTRGKTPWKRGRTYYERIVGRYGLKGLANAIEALNKLGIRLLEYHPSYGGLVPQIEASEVEKVLKPHVKIGEIKRRGARDLLEEQLLELTSHIRSYAGRIILGVTGSILVGIHNSQISDIDIVAYGVEHSSKLREIIPNIPRVELLKYGEIRRLAYNYVKEGRLPPKIALKALSNRWSRFRYRGRLVTISIVLKRDELHLLSKPSRVETLGSCRVVGEIEVTETTHIYPPTWRLEVEKVIGGVNVKDWEVEVLSFENLYSYAFEGGERVLVEGLLQEARSPGKSWFRLAVGCREYPGKIDLYN